MDGASLRRRECLAGAAAGALLGLSGPGTRPARDWERTLDFRSLAEGQGWPGWTCAGVANLRRDGGHGLLEAGSDVFPCDPRPVAFAVDQRFADGEITAELDAGGAGAGVVVRRVGPRDYYAAVYDAEQARWSFSSEASPTTGWGARPLPRRSPRRASRLSLRRAGALPTDADRDARTATAPGRGLGDRRDARASARRAIPACSPPRAPSSRARGRRSFPALGNLHLLPYGVQEGQVIIDTAVGAGRHGADPRALHRLVHPITSARSGSPADDPALRDRRDDRAPLAGVPPCGSRPTSRPEVEIEVASDADFRRTARGLARVRTSFGGASPRARGLPDGRVHWRAHLTRRGKRAVGPTRSFKTLPRAESESRRGSRSAPAPRSSDPLFEQLAARRPDVFVWQGDLNYPDTLGPLAQTVPGYAGIWRDFLANPAMARARRAQLFAAQRDDHDYGLQDANSTNLVPWGLKPWEALMERRLFYRFAAGRGGVLGPRPAPLQERPRSAGHDREDAPRRAPARLAAPHAHGLARPLQGDLLSLHARAGRRKPARRQLGRRLHRRARPPARPHPRGTSRAHGLRHRRHPLDHGLRPRRALRGEAVPARHPDAERHHPDEPESGRGSAREFPASATPTTSAATSRWSRSTAPEPARLELSLVRDDGATAFERSFGGG